MIPAIRGIPTIAYGPWWNQRSGIVHHASYSSHALMKDIHTDPTASGVKLPSRQQEHGSPPSYREILEHACRMNQLQPIEWIQILDSNYHYQHMMEIRHLHHRPHRHQQPRQLPQRAMLADYALRAFPDSVVEPDQANQHKERDPEGLRPKVMNYPL